MRDREELHVMKDGEKMDEDKETSGNEEIGDEDQHISRKYRRMRRRRRHSQRKHDS